MNFKKHLTRAGIGLGTIAVVIAGAAAFSAFEAHVVNVTATIENATTMNTTPLTFGDMFPQEIRILPETISLSSSFLSQNNTLASSVDYVIKQKPKCGLPATGVASGTPTSYTAFEQVTEDGQGIFSCPTQGYVMLPLLCPYLSKTSPTLGDTSVPSFHGPTSTPEWTDQVSVQTQAVGHLSKTGATSTTWQIDMHTPCFKGECAQDWASFVHTANASADANAYMADPANEHQQFGCDLWFEVSGINSTSTPTSTPVGALLSAYTAPTVNQCDGGTVTGTSSIQSAINAASADQTVCVDPSYDGTGDNAPIQINKDNLTLAGLGSAGAAHLDQGVIIDNDGGKVTGLTLGLSTSLGETFSVYVNSGVDNAEVSYNQAIGSGSPSRGVVNALGTTTNLLVSNNKFTGFATGVFLNDSSNMTVDHNTLTGNTVGLSADHPNGSTVTFNTIKNNTLEGVGTLVAAADSIHVHSNNIYNNNSGTLSNLDNYDATGTVDATNNWWGGPTAMGINAQSGSAGTVNTAPVSPVAFPEN